MNKLIVTTLFLTLLSCVEKPSDRITEEESKIIQKQLGRPFAFPKIEFNDTIHNFGTINEGEMVSTDFEIKNTGKVDLVIIDAKGSCGCTVPEPPKKPIPPGETSKMNVKFNSDGKPGMQEKTITILSNTETGIETLKIKANVLPKQK